MNVPKDSYQIIHRLALIKDVEAVYDLYMDEASNPYLTYDPMAREDFDRIFQELLPTNTLYVAESGHDVIATYRLIPKKDRQAHTIYLGGFAVSHSVKGRGIGTKILDYIKKSAAREGKSRIELTVDIYNKPAISLYKKVGFEIEGHIRNSYTRSATNKYYDEYLMGILI